MNLDYYVVDAFADEVFKGNQAAVYVLEEWLPEGTMQKIAIENNLSETAFTVKKNQGFELRWFTPDREIDLCGHATLATAFVLFNYYKILDETIKFSGSV
ncbi:PhzF family phenazine biosynthesis protein [Enterococcus faecium]|nr:PhzF family phenazine biosynthesis protein [Enterococcus faecium]